MNSKELDLLDRQIKLMNEYSLDCEHTTNKVNE